MNTIAPHDRPRLEPGCRISNSGEQAGLLMIPEGAIRLNGPALKIVECCDGSRTFAEIVSLLQSQFAGSDSETIKKDAAELLVQLQRKRIVAIEKATQP